VRAAFVHNKAGNLGLARFNIFCRDAIGANVGRGEDQNLAGVTRVGQGLLVSGHRRAENNFTDGLNGRTK
jgi:hypothetical protein